MSKWLKKEYTIKVKVWRIILDALISSIIISVAMYFFLTDCGSSIIKVLEWINTEHTELEVVLIMYPALLILILTLEIAVIIASGTTTKSKKK